jgi:hypothetical protein
MCWDLMRFFYLYNVCRHYRLRRRRHHHHHHHPSRLGPNGPASASSNTLFYGLPSRLQFCIIFRILSLLILATCRSRFDLYLPSFSSTGSTFSSFQNFFTLFVVKNCVPGRSEKLVTLAARCAALGKYMQNGCSVPAAVRVNFFIT